MDQFTELYGCSSNDTLRFFHTHLHDAVPDSRLSEEKAYTASVLAHYAQVSSSSETDFPIRTNLSGIHDEFVLKLLLDTGRPALSRPDSEKIMEVAGSQTLVMVGFFRDQMRRRHNLNVFEGYGRMFFGMSADACLSSKKSILLNSMSVNFHVLAKGCCKLSRNLRDNPYLIKPPAA